MNSPGFLVSILNLEQCDIGLHTTHVASMAMANMNRDWHISNAYDNLIMQCVTVIILIGSLNMRGSMNYI